MSSAPPAAAVTAIGLTVVIPFLDEAENVAGLLEELARALRDRDDWELIAVDDASGDATAARLAESFVSLGLRGSIIRHGSTRGQSSALASGFAGARGAWVATLDGDGQNDPADLPRLLALVEGTADSAPALVCGWRQQRRDTLVRRWSSALANRVRAGLLGDATPDTGCGLKLARRSVLVRLPYFDHMHRFLPALVRRDGGRVLSVPVNHRPRRHGRSKYGVWNRLWVGLVDLAGVMWLARRTLVREPYEETRYEY
jgi:dolichol-phosphate mannosyltransferase